ncbi:MAG: ATP-binding protein [Thermodesulfobacteriota bacterium]
MKKDRTILNYLVIGIMLFMIAVAGVFIYAGVHLRDKVIVRIVQQTEMTSDLITRSAYDIMSAGHEGGIYSRLLAYRNVIGVGYIGIFRNDGAEAFNTSTVQAMHSTRSPRVIGPGERETFRKAVTTKNSTGFFDRENNSYTRYVPLKAEGACLKCHTNEEEVLGVLKIRLYTESEFDLLSHTRKLIWLLGLIVFLPVGALLVAGAVIREKNRLYGELEKSNASLKETYGELNHTQFYLQMILDNSKVLIITTDREGRIVEFNREAEQVLEYSKEEVVGRDVLMLYEGGRQRETGMGGQGEGVWEIRNREVRLVSKSGKVYDVSLTLSTMVESGGRIIGTVGVGKDISEQKMLQFKLLQSEKLAGIGTLASGIAHEINNPLAGILGMAEAVMDEDDMETIKSHTSDIIRYSETAKKIVKELSEYSRSAKNTSESVVDLSAAIENSVKMARHSASFNSIEIHTDFQRDCLVNANQVEMQQVFVNLVVNAIHAMGDRGVMILKCWREGALVKVRISDSGPGIPEENLTHIYDPFFTTKPVGMGTGLGLYVVYRIVTKYGGSIDVESREGVGTAFTLKFPVADVERA